MKQRFGGRKTTLQTISYNQFFPRESIEEIVSLTKSTLKGLYFSNDVM